MQISAAAMTKLVARLEKILNRDDELAGWSISRSQTAITIIRTYRSGVTHTLPISTADPDFINESL